jgi:hypothetical protein
VACKQWHDLPAEKTVNQGSYQNPADLSFVTYKLVRFEEVMVGGKLKWLFFPDQCRHCIDPPCVPLDGSQRGCQPFATADGHHMRALSFGGQRFFESFGQGCLHHLLSRCLSVADVGVESFLIEKTPQLIG